MSQNTDMAKDMDHNLKSPDLRLEMTKRFLTFSCGLLYFPIFYGGCSLLIFETSVKLNSSS